MDRKTDRPIRLNFNNLDEATQNMLLQRSRQEVQRKCGPEIKAYANENHLDYESLLEEEAIKNLYRRTFKFTI